MPMSCENCKFVLEIQSRSSWSKEDEVIYSEYVCRRFPPVFSGTTTYHTAPSTTHYSFPDTTPKDWCGEYQYTGSREVYRHYQPWENKE